MKSGGSADGSRKELVDQKGKVLSSSEPNTAPEMTKPFGRMTNARETDKTPPGTSSIGRFQDTDPLSKEAGNPKMEEKSGPPSDHFVLSEERKHLQTSRKPDAEMQIHESTASQAGLTMPSQLDSSGARSGLAVSAPGDKMENGHLQVGRANQSVSIMAVNRPMNPETVGWTAVGSHDEVSRGVLPPSSLQHDLVPERKDNALSQVQKLNNIASSGNQHADHNLSSLSLRDRWKPVSGMDNNYHTVHMLKDAHTMPKHVSQGENHTAKLIYIIKLSFGFHLS